MKLIEWIDLTLNLLTLIISIICLIILFISMFGFIFLL